MAEKYLNETTAIFKCNQAVVPVPLLCRESSNSKASETGKGKLLTEGAKIKAPAGLCRLLMTPAGPLPCRCTLTSWQNLSKNTADKKKLLTEKSKNHCIIGGTISLANVSTHVEKGAILSVVDEIMSVFPVWQPYPREQKKASQKETVTVAEANNRQVQKADNRNTNQYLQVNAEIKESKIQSEMLCSVGAGTCTEAKMRACPYYQLCASGIMPEVNNDSQKLAQNYLAWTKVVANRDEADKQFYSLQAEWEIAPWSYAAHHIISGNQVFAKNLKILQLAAFLQYDINRAENCIYLISKPLDYGEIPKEYRNVSAYNLMSLAKLQWHVSGHQYSFSASEREALQKGIKCYFKQEQTPFPSYVDLLSQDLRKLEKRLYVYAQKNACCWLEQPKLRDNFVKNMNRIAKRVKNKLGDFIRQPQLSFPYYVSKEAYLYAFSLPKTGKIIVAFTKVQQPGTLYLRKYRVTHSKDSHGREQDFLKYKQIADTELAQQDFCLHLTDNSKKQKMACIRFCSNIIHFVLFAPAKAEMLPFSQHIETISLTKEIWQNELKQIERVLNRNDVQIQLSIWLRDTADANYIAPQRMIHERC